MKSCLFQPESDPGGIGADHNLVRQDLGHDARILTRASVPSRKNATGEVSFFQPRNMANASSNANSMLLLLNASPRQLMGCPRRAMVTSTPARELHDPTSENADPPPWRAAASCRDLAGGSHFQAGDHRIDFM